MKFSLTLLSLALGISGTLGAAVPHRTAVVSDTDSVTPPSSSGSSTSKMAGEFDIGRWLDAWGSFAASSKAPTSKMAGDFDIWRWYETWSSFAASSNPKSSKMAGEFDIGRWLDAWGSFAASSNMKSNKMAGEFDVGRWLAAWSLLASIPPPPTSSSDVKSAIGPADIARWLEALGYSAAPASEEKTSKLAGPLDIEAILEWYNSMYGDNLVDDEGNATEEDEQTGASSQGSAAPKPTDVPHN